VVAVRHAPVAPVAAGRVHGTVSDPDADREALRRLAPALAPLLARHPPDRVLSSPSRRARQTAALVGEPEVDARLAERAFGLWERRDASLVLSGLDSVHLASAEAWLAASVTGAEAPEAVAARGADLWRELTADRPETVWCVGSAGALRALLASARGWDLARAFAVPLPHGQALRLPWRQDTAAEATT
jgi:broad specificity phosphatase PhoE